MKFSELKEQVDILFTAFQEQGIDPEVYAAKDDEGNGYRSITGPYEALTEQDDAWELQSVITYAEYDDYQEEMGEDFSCYWESLKNIVVVA